MIAHFATGSGGGGCARTARMEWRQRVVAYRLAREVLAVAALPDVHNQLPAVPDRVDGGTPPTRKAGDLPKGSGSV